MDIKDTLIGIGAGAASGAIAAFLGYAKSAGETFDYKKALQTVIVGGFVGGVAGGLGVSYQEGEAWLNTIGGLTLFEYIKKTVLRRVFKTNSGGLT